MISTEKVLKFILSHIDAGTIDEVFNPSTLIESIDAYRLDPYGIMVSKQFLEDVIKKPDHYRQFIPKN